MFTLNSSKFPQTVTVLRTLGQGNSEYVLKDVTDLYDLLDRQPKVENGVIVEGGVTNIVCNICNDDGQFCPDMSFAFPEDFTPMYGRVGEVANAPVSFPFDW